MYEVGELSVKKTGLLRRLKLVLSRQINKNIRGRYALNAYLPYGFALCFLWGYRIAKNLQTLEMARKSFLKAA